MPPFRLAISQVLVGCCDWISAGAVLYMLLPADANITFFSLLCRVCVAQTLGVVSHVPGGLGVFETVMVHALTPTIPATNLLATLVLLPGYLLPVPLSVAAVSLAGANELLSARGARQMGGAQVGEWLPGIVPQILGWATFVGGAVLLFSGATPPLHGRFAWLNDLLPLPVIQFSHFLNSIVGAGLLILARGIQRRLDVSYVLTIALLTAGILFSLLKGLDYEEAIILAIMLLALLPCRRYFYRKSSLISQRFTPGWLVLVGAVLIGSVWLTFFLLPAFGLHHLSVVAVCLAANRAGSAASGGRGNDGAGVCLRLARLMRAAPEGAGASCSRRLRCRPGYCGAITEHECLAGADGRQVADSLTRRRMPC